MVLIMQAFQQQCHAFGVAAGMLGDVRDF